MKISIRKNYLVLLGRRFSLQSEALYKYVFCVVFCCLAVFNLNIIEQKTLLQDRDEQVKESVLIWSVLNKADILI